MEVKRWKLVEKKYLALQKQLSIALTEARGEAIKDSGQAESISIATSPSPNMYLQLRFLSPHLSAHLPSRQLSCISQRQFKFIMSIT